MLPRLPRLALLAFVGCGGCTGAEPGPICDGCNVVLVSMDTLRADHVGAYGYDRPATPSIDRLARRSVIFADAIGQSAWTRPAHFSMFTGLYPSEHGVVAMAGRSRLPAGVPTLAAVLSQAGWSTGAFTGGANLSAHFGFDEGFDVYESHGKRMLDNLDAALAWLEAHSERRFFLFFHGLDAHRPYPSEAVDRRALGLDPDTPPAWRPVCKSQRRADVQPLIDAYDAAAHRGDRAVGVLLDALDAAGVSSNTVVIVTSDHGEELRDHGECFHIRSLHREIVRVPLIVRVPGVAARAVSGVVPASAAVAPTVLDLLGVARAGIGGPSLDAVVRGAAPGFGRVVSETSSRYRAHRPDRRSGHVRAITTDDEKLLHWVDAGRLEYFDLRRDPFERRPSTALAPGAAGLLRALEGFVARHPPLPRTAGTNGDADAPLPRKLRRELRKLGYLR